MPALVVAALAFLAAALACAIAARGRRPRLGTLVRRPRAWRAALVAGSVAALVAYALAPRAQGAVGHAALGVVLLAALLFAGAYVVWMGADGGGRVARALDVVTFNALATVVLLELALRVYAPRSRHPLLVPEAVTGLDLAQDVHLRAAVNRFVPAYGVRANSDGFRDEEFVRPKPDGVFRVVALADSFGIGYAVPLTHHHLVLLEDELASVLAAPAGVEVCNLGISAIGPGHYLAALESFGLELEPDLVVAYLFLGNDFPEAPATPFASRWDWLFVHRIATRIARVRKSRAVRELAAERRQRPPWELETEATPWVDDVSLEVPTLPPEEFEAIERQRASVFSVETGESYYEPAIGYLERMHRVAQHATGRPLVVVAIPDELQVDDELRATIAAQVPFELDLEQPNRHLARRLAELGIVLVDLLEPLRAGQRELGRVYHLRDTHWNARGHRIAAESLARALAAHRERLDLP